MISPTRRDVLRLGAAGAAGALAGCSTSTGRAPSGSGSGASAGTGAGAGASASSPSAAAWDRLAAQLSRGLARPGSPGWAPADLLYDPHLGRASSPAAIARCASADDVAACVRFAADTGVDLRVRAGGHSYSGASSGPGLVADLAPLAGVDVGAAASGGTAVRVGAGALLADVYAAVAARGLALGAGSCPTVGISGLTLGGGVGVLAPSFGLTCDQVTSATVVTADARVRQVSADEEADLFWALRGGGAGLAAVVGWTFAGRPAPAVTTFRLQWPWTAAADVLAAWQSWTSTTPRELWSSARLLADPGTGLSVLVAGTWTGSGDVSGVLAPLLAQLPAPASRSTQARSFADAMLYEAGCTGLDAPACRARAVDAVHRRPFAATSSILAHPLPAAGVAAAVEAVAAAMATAGLVEAGMAFDALGGAIADVAAADTAFGWRSALATVQHTATWTSATAAAGPYEDLVHAQRRALAPWCGTAAYVNYADAALLAGAGAAADCWGEGAQRLARVRAAHDPDGVLSPRA